KKGFYYCYNLKAEKISTAEILQKHLPAILQKMSSLWRKSMFWLDNSRDSVRWVRPIRNILCVFNHKIVPFNFANLSTNNQTFGHLFLSNKAFEVSSFEQYKKNLAENFVVLSSEDRKNIIISGIKDLCKELGCYSVEKLEEDNALLNEVVGLVEYPQVMFGEIDQKFMSLPYEVLVLTLKRHQKYFCLKDKKGNLAPYFIFVSNIKSSNPSKIITDNQKVLNARLNDAKFFIEEDLKI